MVDAKPLYKNVFEPVLLRSAAIVVIVLFYVT
jgi:hypothetical protein